MARIAKDRLWRGGRITNHLSRLGHYRGNGIHSPFVYYAIRNIFMSRQLQADAAPLFEALQHIDIEPRTAIEIANMVHYCSNGDAFLSIDQHSPESQAIVCTSQCSDLELLRHSSEAAKSGTTLVILAPYKRRNLCDELLKGHRGTSIDRFSYLILLNNHLPKQHFKL